MAVIRTQWTKLYFDLAPPPQGARQRSDAHEGESKADFVAQLRHLDARTMGSTSAAFFAGPWVAAASGPAWRGARNAALDRRYRGDRPLAASFWCRAKAKTWTCS